MKKYLHEEYLQHFCSLHVAIRILCHPQDCLYNNKYANDLLMYFVQAMKQLYGKNTIVYNVHNVIHLCADVKRLGCLDSFSAFPFENYMKHIKKMIRKTDNPLAQLYNRLAEVRSCIASRNSKRNVENTNLVLLKKPNKKKLPMNCINSHKEIHYKNFVLKTDNSNNCCFLKDKSIFTIKYIGYKNNVAVMIGTRYCHPQSIKMYPCDSANLQIFMGKNQGDQG